MKNSVLVINIIYDSNLFILFNELNSKSDQKEIKFNVFSKWILSYKIKD